MGTTKKRIKKKPIGELIVVLTSGKQYDFFKLPHDVRQAMINDPSTGPAIRKAIDDFKKK